MKKLLIASMAAALTAGAWAAESVSFVSTAESFESELNLSDGYWAVTEGMDTSTVTEKEYVDGDTKYTYSSSTALITDGPGNKYLNLETESGYVLSRNLAADSGAVTVDEDNSYVLDTLVKFTATDEAPTAGSSDKFILWLRSTDATDDGSTTYDLMATCGVLGDDAVGLTGSATNVALNVTVTPDQWVRVSVKTIKLGAGGESAYGTLGFVVYVDGVLAAATEDSYKAIIGSDEVTDTNMSAQGRDYYAKKAVFPCLIQGDSESASTTAVASVGFEGTGAIDDLSITTMAEGPTFAQWTAPAVEYTVSFKAVGLADGTTWTMNDVTVTAGNTLATQTAPTVDGYKVVGWYSNADCTEEVTFPAIISQTMTIYVKYEAEATVKPVAPGESVSGTTEGEAKGAIESAGIADPFTGITDTVKSDYAAKFTATVTGDATTGYTATWTLTEAAEQSLQSDADDVLATTLEAVLDDTKSDVSIKAQPGFYYTVLSSETVGAAEYTANGWTQATGESVTLTLPTKSESATQGFYKIGITAVKPNTEE